MGESEAPGQPRHDPGAGAGASDAPEVSVLTPVLNEERHLRDAARAMLGQRVAGGVEFLFIDGGSTDATPEILQELSAQDPRVRVLENPAGRTPHALNIGLAAARGEFIARMDAHTIYPPDYLQRGVDRLRQGDVASVSGPQIAVGRSAGSELVALALQARLGTGQARFRHQASSEFEVDSGFTGLWRRDTLLRHRGWDEEFINDQDFELAARIRAAGGRIVCVPEMAAAYVPRETLRALARQYVRYGTYRVKTARRHPATLRRSQILPPALALTLPAAVLGPRAARRAARLALGAYGAGLTAGALEAARGGAGRRAVQLPAVWATMHLSYGIGFLRGSLRQGPPLAAIKESLR